jgi:plastocyanin
MIGAADVASLGGRTFVLVAGGGEAHANPDQPAGVYELAPDGTVSLVVDLGAWLRANPVAVAPVNDFDPEGSWFDMTAAPDGSGLWIVESNSEQVVAVTPDGAVTRLADLSEGDLVPTAIAPAPGGGLYVGFLSAAPFPAGGAKVVRIDESGATSDAWTGLTMVTGIAVGPEGALFATELSSSQERPPFVTPGTGRLLRQTGLDSAAEVVTGLDQPVALAFGPDGALYVSLPAVGANEATGLVVRVSPPGDGSAVAFDPRQLDLPSCGNRAGTPPASQGDGTAPQGTVTGDEPPVVAGGNTETEVIIRIFDFGFDPAEITIPAGTTVMWINTGAVQHTTVARVGGELLWDSGILEAGGTYQVTFNAPGGYDYVCGLHPNMTGRIVVE